MATKNLNTLQQLAVKYNVSFQPLYSKKAIANGNLESVHQALIGGRKYTSLCTYNKADLENLFKSVAEGNHESSMTKQSCKKNGKQGNSIKFNKDGNTVYINGRKYNVFDIVKDVQIGSLINLLAEKEVSKREQDRKLIEKIVEWFNKSENFDRLFCYKLGVTYSETASNFAEYIKRDNLKPSDMLDDLTIDYNGSIRNYAIDILTGMNDVEPNLENLKQVERCLTKYIGA